MTGKKELKNNAVSTRWEDFRQVMFDWLNRNYVVIAVVIGIVLIGLSTGFDLDAPDPALKEWTAWAAQYVALVIAAQKVWKVSDVAIKGWENHLQAPGARG